MKRLTAPSIRNYLVKNYGRCRHNEFAMLNACRIVAKQYNVSPADIFHFITENKSINGLHVSEYGFNTALGRHIKAEFEHYYYGGE
jgi:hypothetical protein